MLGCPGSQFRQSHRQYHCNHVHHRPSFMCLILWSPRSCRQPRDSPSARLGDRDLRSWRAKSLQGTLCYESGCRRKPQLCSSKLRDQQRPGLGKIKIHSGLAIRHKNPCSRAMMPRSCNVLDVGPVPRSISLSVSSPSRRHKRDGRAISKYQHAAYMPQSACK